MALIIEKPFSLRVFDKPNLPQKWVNIMIWANGFALFEFKMP